MYDLNKKIDELGACKPARSKRKRRRALSLHEEVLSLVQNANSQVADERRVVPRDALTVMNRALASLASLNDESKRIGVLREVNRFISLQHDTYKAHGETTRHGDLLPIGHPLCSLNYTQDADTVRARYAVWLAADSSVPAQLKSLVASAFKSKPLSLERKHAFTRLNLSNDAKVPLFFKLDPIVAAFSFSGGNSSAARRARVALQWRDRKGRWVEMGRGLDFNFRLPNGDIASAGGTYVGVNAARGYSSENGKPVANAGLVEVRGNPNIPDGIYSIESPNATPVKARVPGEALKRAKVKATPSVRKPTAEQAQSQDIPNLDDLLKTRVDAPSGWRKQTELEKATYGDDGSFISDDDYKAIPNGKGGYALHRLDKDGKTGEKVADASSWAEVQKAAEKDSDDYDKFKKTATILDPKDDYKVGWAVDMDIDEFDEDTSIEKSVEAFINANNLDGRVSVREVNDSGYQPEVTFNIPDEAKDDFAKAYGYEDWDSLSEDIEKVDFESENKAGIEGARSAQEERLAETIWKRRTEGGESLEEVARDLGMTPLEVRRIESDYARKNNLGRQDKPADEAAPKTKIGDKFTYFDEANPPRLSPDNKNVEVELLLDDAPKFYTGDPAGPSNLEEYGIPYITDEGMGEDGIYRASISVPLDKMDDFVRDWNEANYRPFDLTRDTPQEFFGDIYDNYKAETPAPEQPVEEAPAEVNYRKADMNADLLRAGFLLPTYFPTPGGQRNLLARRDRDPNYEMPPADEVLRVANMRGNPRKLVVTVRSLETGEERKFGINKNSKLYDVRVPEKPTEATPEDVAPPVPSSPEEGVPVKTPSPATPSTPSLFNDFDAPNGAFQLRTVEYEPDGRVDEASADFTDDPDALARRYPLPVLVRALTESLIGKKDDDILNDIVDSNLGDDDESLDLEELNDVVDTPAPQAGRANGTGAGTLDFSAGEEFVPAEALYNAVFKAGGDPNRVIANAYDAVHGDRRNLEKLTQAAGELPSPEEQQLVDDMMQEIGQIKDSTPEGESPVSNIISEPNEEPLLGELLSNIPIAWDDPTYYVPDPNPYIPTTPEPDENGYSDSPEFIARNYYTADLIQQYNTVIKEGSGSAYLFYGDNDVIFEVPLEAIRDALQLQGVNTNTLNEDIKNEENSVQEPEALVRPPLPEREEVEPVAQERVAGEAPSQGAVDAIAERYGTLPNDLNWVAYLPADGSIAFSDVWDETSVYIARPDGSIFPANAAPDWFTDPRGAGQAGWTKLNEDQIRDIYSSQTAAPAGPPQVFPDSPAAPEVEDEPSQEPAAPTAPAFTYPGPREPGYSPNNTTLARGGVVIGKGSRVVATKDNKSGTVVAIQNNPEYVRIKFDDGTTQVRAAGKVKAISDPSGVAPTRVEPSKPAQGVETRLDQPTAPAPRLARAGDTVGVNDESTRPQWLEGLTNENAVQSDFSAWGDRDAEIAKAARERITVENLHKQVEALYGDITGRDRDKRREAQARLAEIMGDIYGARNGITFGGKFFSVAVNTSALTGRIIDEESADFDPERSSYGIATSLSVRNESGNVVGEIRREITFRRKLDENGNVVDTETFAKNHYLALTGNAAKKNGFASAFNRYSENWYIANGVDKVKVLAAGGNNYQGGFVWALNGFNWDTSMGTGINIREFEREVSNREEEAQVEYLKQKIARAKKPNGEIDYALFPTPLEFALVGWHPGAKDWIGKRVMISNSWSGVKNLQPTAREQVQSVNYAQIKNAERRIESNQNVPNLSTDIQTIVESDKFRNSPTIAPFYNEIRDVLKNNRSLAFLSPSAKNALNAYVSEQVLDRDRVMSMDDMFRLRNGLINEYRADHGYSDPFNSAEVLSQFTTEDFSNAARFNEDGPLKDAGFSVRRLSYDESGVNATFEVTHKPSGQVFYVKNEEFASSFTNVPGGVTELEAVTLLRALGLQGVHDVRIGQNDIELVIMSRAGSNIPLIGEASNAADVFRRGIRNEAGRVINVSDGASLLSAMDAPEDFVRMSIFDMLGNNEDRHNGNWMMAVDKATGKVRIFPVDNTIGVIEKDPSGNTIVEFLDRGGFNDSGAYDRTIPALIYALGTDNLMKIYQNEINKLTENLDDPLYKPKGYEMDRIIAKWGSYDAFKDAITQRLGKLTTQGTDEYNALKNALRLGYWSE